MYGYALYRSLLEQGKDVKLDVSFYDNQKEGLVVIRTFEIDDIFNLNCHYMSKLDYLLLLILERLQLIPVISDKEDYLSGYKPAVLEARLGIIDGYWQSFKYSANIEWILKKGIHIQGGISEQCQHWLSRIEALLNSSIDLKITNVKKVK